MKNRLSLAAFAICTALAIMFITGCDHENASYAKQGQPLANAEQILSAYNAGKFPQDQTKLFVGEGNIIVKQDEILIQAACPDNDYISTYYLQAATAQTRLASGPLGSCEFLFLGTTLIVNPLNQASIMAFSLTENPNAEYTKDIKITTEYLGYGLGESRAPRSLSQRDAPAPKCKCLDRASASDEDCESGGYGATSCSITTEGGSCSVTCTSGLTYEYFACCDVEGTIVGGN